MASSWERLATASSSSASTITTSAFTPKKHLKIIVESTGGSSSDLDMQFGTGGSIVTSGYTQRRTKAYPNSADTTNTSQSRLRIGDGSYSLTDYYFVGSIINIDGYEKQVIGHGINNNTGNDQVPNSYELAGKWTTTSGQINIIKVGSIGDGATLTGLKITVYGADDQTITAKDKSTITNVPDGTRYEETDTRKIFHKRTQTGSGGGDIWVEKGNTFSASALRGFASGGSITGASSNVIDYVTISTLGNAADFGDLTNARQSGGSCADATRCVEGAAASIDYWTAATLGNATDFGDLTSSRSIQNGAFADSTRGVFAGGNNTIDYITIQSAGNATDFGDLQGAYEQTSGCADATRGLICGGWTGAYVNSIDYITIQTTGNAADFGDMTVGRYALASTSDATRGCTSGGHSGSLSNVIDYVTIQTTGNATDFGDLYVAIHKHTAYADATRGCIGVGGANGGRRNVIQYITIQTTGNSADFGDITEDKEVTAGCAA